MARLMFRLGLLLFLYTVLRGVFLTVHWDLLAHYTAWDILRSFVIGLRFDLSAIVLINIPFFLLDALGFRSQQGLWSRVERGLFVAVNAVFLGVNLGDVEYFSFSGQRLTLMSLLGVATDLKYQLANLTTYYWGFMLAFAGIVVVLWFFSKRPLRAGTDYNGLSSCRRALQTLVTIALGVLAVRGGLQGKPLSTAHAMSAGQGVLRHLTLNSSFTLLKSYNQNELTYEKVLSSWEVLRQRLLEQRGAVSRPLGSLPRSNVVLLILESFNREFLDPAEGGVTYAPFVSELARSGLVFDTFFASGRRSIDALPSIFAGVPALLAAPFIVSGFESVELRGFPETLVQSGYETSFFHGGNDGTMYFDVMSKMFGIEKYYDASDYPKEGDYDGQWGIFDEPYLQFVAHSISEFKKPFFAGVFTLSSHHPYVVPTEYEDTLPAGTRPIHKTIAYTDKALEAFFATARSMDWFSNTLFVLTADHTTDSDLERNSAGVGRFHVPLILWHPQVDLSPFLTDPHVLASHVDIGPTLLDLLGVEPMPYPAFGSSLARDVEHRQVLLPGDQGLWMLEGQRLTAQGAQGRKESFLWQEDFRLTSPEPASEKEAKDLSFWWQYFAQGLTENRLLMPQPSTSLRATFKQDASE